MRTRSVPRLVIPAARSFAAVAVIAYVIDLLRQTRDHLTNGALRPFGDDFLNYWSGAFLALNGRAAEVYDFKAFHAFEQSVAGAAIDYYHYSYPPVLLMLTAPLAFVPYVPALFLWLGVTWYAFYRGLGGAMAQGVLLLALAAPAVFINAVGGQNGMLTAALFGGGLGLLARRPMIAGVLFGLLIYKPQIGLLLPVALIAGRQWRAFAAAAVTVIVLISASALLFGADLWTNYAANFAALRHGILEDGSGVWHRMVSVFVTARRLGASVETAYIVQDIAALAAATVVAVAWWRDRPGHERYALLLLGTCFATPYLQDYDLVFLTFAIAWLWRQRVGSVRYERALLIVCALLILLPFLASPLAHVTGIAFGPLFILPAFILAGRRVFSSQISVI